MAVSQSSVMKESPDYKYNKLTFSPLSPRVTHRGQSLLKMASQVRISICIRSPDYIRFDNVYMRRKENDFIVMGIDTRMIYFESRFLWCSWRLYLCTSRTVWEHYPYLFVAEWPHYDDVIMSAIASQITSLTIVYSTVYPGADQSKHQSSASLAFVWGIHRGPVNSPHKWPVTQIMFPFDDVIMHIASAILVNIGFRYNGMVFNKREAIDWTNETMI